MLHRIVLFSYLIAGIFTTTTAQDRLTPELLWELGRVSIDDLSPDGNTVLFGVTWYDIEADDGNRDLYMIPTQGGDAKKITAFEESEHNGKYLPNGKIAFLRDDMLWEMNTDGTDQRQVSDEPMNGFKFSPDGRHILFIRDVEYKAGPIEEPHDDLPNASGKVITDLMYRHWDTWEDEKYSNIFVATYHDGALTSEPKNIMNEPYDTPLQPFDGMEDISWDAGGARIAYTCKKSAGREYTLSTDSDIYLYDLSSGETKNITEGMPGYDKEPVFSPNGRYLAWNSMARAGFESDRNRIFLMDLQTGEKRELTAGLNRDASHPKWSRNSNTVFFTVGENATYQIASIEVATGEFRMITEGTHNYNDIRVAGPAYLVGALTSMSMPQEIYRINLLSGGQKQVSFINEPILRNVKMGDVKPRWVMTTDSMHMLVWMIYPPDFDPTKKYPTLLYCQGGPQSAVSQFWSYRWNFQLMAANDYIIVAPNRRGLPSFGRQWNDQISGDWGGQAMDDYLSAIDNAMQELYVDTSNVGAVGASFGGYSVYWLAGNHDKRFSAFVSHCGLFNLESWYGTTEEMFFANWDLGGPYWDSTYHEEYEKFSPHTYVENWDTPMLVIHGENDFRVPVSEGIQAFHAAQLRGIPSRFLYYPDEGHWVLKPQNGLMWHREYFNWLDKWLKNEPRS